MAGRRGEIALTEEEQRQFLEDGWTLQVASIGPHGYPHLVAMWYVVVDGEVCFTTFRKSQKILNLKRDPKITVMLESGKKYNGMPVPTETPDAVSPTAAKRVTVRVRAKDIYSWDHAKLGGRY